MVGSGQPFLLTYPRILRRAFKQSHSLLQLEMLISWLGKGSLKVVSAQKVPIDLLLSHPNQPPSRVRGYEKYVRFPRSKCLLGNACTIVWG